MLRAKVATQSQRHQTAAYEPVYSNRVKPVKNPAHNQSYSSCLMKLKNLASIYVVSLFLWLTAYGDRKIIPTIEYFVYIT